MLKRKKGKNKISGICEKELASVLEIFRKPSIILIL